MFPGHQQDEPKKSVSPLRLEWSAVTKGHLCLIGQGCCEQIINYFMSRKYKGAWCITEALTEC